ncbi:Pyrophosphorylase [Frankia canadensis]|uniref:Pyrophosphorylase n=2 Tax=Frankia canadensis TaxID=1836972 RepID=A0A2I2KN69_9ACTN|nr:Pyrophosphorylase [Frankia canadensis]SOU54404.1 Pyrophosphorylase [Frankia canadensis]
MTRVVSTDTARDAIGRMQQIINSGLSQEIKNLEHEGQLLSDPNNWDGGLAVQFRTDIWPQTKTALDNAVTQLGLLQQKVSQINTDIMTAGGS